MLSQQQHVVKMANQIAQNAAAYAPDVAVGRVKRHLERYWEPRMLRDLFDVMDNGGSELAPVVLAAAKALKAQA